MGRTKTEKNRQQWEIIYIHPSSKHIHEQFPGQPKDEADDP
jgi:hypothetical protein